MQKIRLILILNLMFLFSFANADIDKQSGGEPLLMNYSLTNSTFEKIEAADFYEYVAGSKNHLMVFTPKIENENIQLYLYNQVTEEVKEFHLELNLISPEFESVINTGKKSFNSKKWEKLYFPH